MNDIEKIDKLLLHIRNVQDNAIILGKKLIENGEIVFGKNLIINAMKHDISKFYGIEWINLHKEAEKADLKEAIYHHVTSNPHHPEFWQNGVNDMPDLYIAEFCCDTLARSQELASDYLEWLSTHAAEKYNFTIKSKFYKKVLKYYNLIIDNPFKKIK